MPYDGNTDSPFGLRPVRHLNGNPWSGATYSAYIHADYATALFVGDAVELSTATATQDPTGKRLSIRKGQAGNAKFIFGVITSFEPTVTNLNNIYLPASTGGIANVCIDPDVIFQIRDDGAATPTKLYPGQNAVLIFTESGSTTTGLSGMELDTNSDVPAADASNQLFILNVANNEGQDNVNDSGYAGRTIWEVLINYHQLKCTGDGDGALGVTAS